VKFKLTGAAGVLEVSLETASSRTVHDLRGALENRGIKGAEAEKIIDDVIVSGITRMSRQFERIKAKHIDTVVKLRSEIDALYHDIFIGPEAGTQAGVKKAVEGRADNLRKLYTKLDEAIENATLPLEKMNLAAEVDEGVAGAVKGVEAENLPHGKRPIEADLKREGRGKTRLGRKGFKAFEGGYRVRFADGAETVLKIENGRYIAEIFTPPGVNGGQKSVIREFSVSHEPYKMTYKTTSVLQRNHVCQNSLMQKLFGPFGYDGNQVPTVWMRDSRVGSPHGKVTAGQRTYKTQQGATIDAAEKAAKSMGSAKPLPTGTAPLAPSQLNLGEIQRMGIAQMKGAGCPDAAIAEYMRSFNRYFESQVMPKLKGQVEGGRMTQAQLDSLLGDWKPGTGIPQ
jgi:hypothetical protein